MKYLNYKQLAFVLSIPPIKALEKIIAAHCKMKGVDLPYPQEKAVNYLFDFVVKDGKKVKVRNSTPDTLSVDDLALHLGIPTLKESIEDIQKNYLNRPASKKYILSDYPEKQLINKTKKQVKLPPALKSMLPSAVISEIHNQWNIRYGIMTK